MPPHAGHGRPQAVDSPATAVLILVIDDDPIVHDLMRRALRARTDSASRSPPAARKGIRRARELRPDVITLDILMPQKDGWKVLAELKADPDLSSIPVVLVSIIDDKQLGFALGASDYLTKPVDFDRLGDVLAGSARSPPTPTSWSSTTTRPCASSSAARWKRQAGASREADNGKAGLDLIRQSPPALIVLDLLMPEMDGFTVIEQLRKEPAWKAHPGHRRHRPRPIRRRARGAARQRPTHPSKERLQPRRTGRHCPRIDRGTLAAK